MSYQIFTDATADMNSEMQFGLPNIEVIPMEVVVGGTVYTYGPGGNLTPKRFYQMLREGAYANTTQIKPDTYREAFEPYLKEGIDVFYMGFSSGLSGTMNSAQVCARELEEEYPERKIVCLDTLCASVGEGFLVCEAAKRQATGMELDELVIWAATSCLDVCHWFAVDTFEHLRHGGRVSNAAAVAGSILNIKPLLHVDEEGKLKVVEKPRGTKRAMEAKLERMRQGWMPEKGELVVVGHADCIEKAESLCVHIEEEFPNAEIQIVDIGPVIGAHTGPGMLAVIYWGNNR